MFDFFLSPLSFLLVFVLYICSDIIRPRRWAKICRNLAFVALAITISIWLISLNDKANAGRNGYHQQLVNSVTYHVEQLLKKGDYKSAMLILNRFNTDYWKYSNDNKGLKEFIESIDIPLFSHIKAELRQLSERIDERGNSEQTAPPDTEGLAAPSVR